MTTEARGRLAALALVLCTALVVVGGMIRNDAMITGGISGFTLVLGYAFGDRNGERRLSDALAQSGLHPGVHEALRASLAERSAIKPDGGEEQ